MDPPQIFFLLLSQYNLNCTKNFKHFPFRFLLYLYNVAQIFKGEFFVIPICRSCHSLSNINLAHASTPSKVLGKRTRSAFEESCVNLDSAYTKSNHVFKQKISYIKKYRKEAEAKNIIHRSVQENDLQSVNKTLSKLKSYASPKEFQEIVDAILLTCVEKDREEILIHILDNFGAAPHAVQHAFYRAYQLNRICISESILIHIYSKAEHDVDIPEEVANHIDFINDTLFKQKSNYIDLLTNCISPENGNPDRFISIFAFLIDFFPQYKKDEKLQKVLMSTAINKKSLQIAQFLHSMKASLNFLDEEKDPMPIKAARNNDIPMLKWLQERKVDFFIPGSNNSTLLLSAAETLAYDVLQWVLKNGFFSNIYEMDDDCETVFDKIVDAFSSDIDLKEKCIKELKRYSREPISFNAKKSSLIHRAALHGAAKLIPSLIEGTSFNINAKDQNQNTPLHYIAKKYPSEKVLKDVSLLLSLEADPLIPNAKHKTSLDLAISKLKKCSSKGDWDVQKKIVSLFAQKPTSYFTLYNEAVIGKTFVNAIRYKDYEWISQSITRFGYTVDNLPLLRSLCLETTQELQNKITHICAEKLYTSSLDITLSLSHCFADIENFKEMERKLVELEWQIYPFLSKPTALFYSQAIFSRWLIQWERSLFKMPKKQEAKAICMNLAYVDTAVDLRPDFQPIWIGRKEKLFASFGFISEGSCEDKVQGEKYLKSYLSYSLGSSLLKKREAGSFVDIEILYTY